MAMRASRSVGSATLHSGPRTIQWLGPRCHFSARSKFAPNRQTCKSAAIGRAETITWTADDTKLHDYICSGPLLQSCGIQPDKVLRNYTTWKELGARIATQLGFPSQLSDTQRLRIYHYYLPVYFWLEQQLQLHREQHQGTAVVPPLVVGISAPQGCGKSTLVEQLEQLFGRLGKKAVVVSVDDFYLTYQQQSELSEAFPDNKLLKYRGNAGTHDLKLGSDVLEALEALNGRGGAVAVPRYNKSAYAGRGDRSDPSTWPSLTGPLQLVLFEGWMLGFKPLNQTAAAAAVDPDLVEVNQRLQEYEQAWDSHVGSWLVIRVGDPKWVFNWRLQAEHQMAAAGKAAMTDEQVADFVSRFMPAYQAYLPGLYAQGPTTAKAGRTLVVEVDEARSPVVPQPHQIL